MTTPSASTIETLLAETAWVRALAVRLTGSAEEAEDLVQETWVAALRRPPVGGESVRPWLATVLRNRWRQRRRQGAAVRAREEAVAAREGGVPAPEEWLQRLESQEQLSRLVRELPEAQREVVLLRYHEGLTPQRIAERLGAPAGTVRWRLKVALDALRERLDREHGGDRAAWLAALAPLAQVHRRQAAAAAGGGLGAALGAWSFALPAAALVAALGGVAWWAFGRGGDGQGARPVEVAKVTAGTERDVDPRPDRSLDAAPARVPSMPADPAQTDPRDPLADLPWTRVRLRVVDATGAPVAGVHVEVRPGLEALSAVEDLLSGMPPLRAAREVLGHEAETAGDGTALLESRLLRVSADVGIVARGPRFGRWEESLRLDPGADVDLGDVVLQPGGLVACTVRDAAGAPAAARVVVGPAAPDADGDEAAALARGPARELAAEWLDGTGELFVPESGTLCLWSRPGSRGPWTCSAPFELELGTRVAVELRVDLPEPIVLQVVGPDDAPRGARIEVHGERGSSHTSLRRDGRLELGPSYAPGEPLAVTVHDLDQQLAPLATRLEDPRGLVTLRLEPAPVVPRTLRVRSAAGGALEHVEVRIHARGTYAERTSVDGAVALSLPDGPGETFDLEVRADEHVPLTREGLVARDLPEAWDEELSPLPGITGRVSFHGQPVAGAVVRASHRCDPGEWQRARGGLSGVRWGSGWEAEAGADGVFRLPLAWEGNWVLRVRAPGFADALLDLSPYDPARGAIDLSFELQEPGRVEGVLLDAQGAPVARAAVALSHALHEPRTATTDRQGRFTFEGVSPGDWTASAPLHPSTGGGYDLLGLPAEWSPVPNAHVVSGATARCTLRRAGTMPCVGRIALGPLAAEAVGWRIVARVDGADPFDEHAVGAASLGAEGAFQLDLPGEGPWRVTLAGPGLAGTVAWRLALDEVAGPLALELPLARLGARGGEAGKGVQLRLRDAATFEWQAHVALAEGGGFAAVLVPAGRLELELPEGTGVPSLGLTEDAHGLSDLVDRAVAEAVVSAAQQARTRTTVHVTLAPGEERTVDLP